LISVATLGSHCALQLLKGAKDEGLETLLICEKKRESLYRRFKFIDELLLVDSFSEILEQKCESVLQKNNSVLIPHGTLIAQMNSEQIESIRTPIFGNKHILRWESDRMLKEQLMKEAKLETPKSIRNPKEINGLVIAKRHGAAGGKGYFLASTEKEYNEKRDQLIKEGIMVIPPTATSESSGSQGVPAWIKNNAGWWAEGQIDDETFVSGIQYLIKVGIIKVS